MSDLLPDVHIVVLAQVQHRVDALLREVGEQAEEPGDELGAEPLAVVRTLHSRQDLLVLGLVLQRRGFIITSAAKYNPNSPLCN